MTAEVDDMKLYSQRGETCNGSVFMTSLFHTTSLQIFKDLLRQQRCPLCIDREGQVWI